MEPLLISHRTADGRTIRLDLPGGATARFGRGCPVTPVDLPLADAGVPLLVGEVRAEDDHWTLSNLSPDRTLVVENPEGAGEFVKVPAGRVRAPIPFEIARVVLPASHGFVTFTVFASAPTYLAPDTCVPAWSGAFALAESAKYFLVLVALCEPRLRDQSHVDIPTVAQVVQRLRPLPSCAGLTAAAVTYHVDYLARTKLRVKADWPPRRLVTKRAAIVSLALRFDLVREEHLRLLPDRTPGPAGVR